MASTYQVYWDTRDPGDIDKIKFFKGSMRIKGKYRVVLCFTKYSHVAFTRTSISRKFTTRKEYTDHRFFCNVKRC